MSKQRKIRYRTRRRCVQCKVYLGWNTVMGSMGICPGCGHDDNSTVCATDNEVGHWTGFLWWKKWHPKGGDDV